MNKHFSRIFYLYFLFLGIFSPIFAQTPLFELTNFPQNLQLYPRNISTNKASVFAEGTVQKAANLKTMRIRVYRGDSIIQESTVALDTNAQVTNFKIPYDIPAGLTNYNVELSGVQRNNQNVFLKQATQIVAGDVFVINGQSNAIGWFENDNIGDRDSFMRIYVDQVGWREAYGNSVGKWGGRFAKNVIEKEKIPVAVFNQAFGAERITYYLRKSDSVSAATSNYAALYKRLKINNLEKNIAAIFWWQGEADGWDANTDSFRVQTKRLFQQWREDYPSASIFYHQVRTRACGHFYPFVSETQRQLINELPFAEIVTTHPGKISDGCHQSYLNGYDSLGNRLYRMVATKLYGKTAAFLKPPNIVRAVLMPNKDLEMSFSNMPTGNLRGNGNFWQDFRIEGTTTATITGGTVTANKVILKLAGDTVGIKGVSYLSNIDTVGGENRYVVNPQHLGILLFYNYPISSNSTTNLKNISTKSFDFSVSPTLVDGRMTIALSEKLEQAAHLHIVNLLGKTVFSTKITEGGVLLDLKTDFLPNGTYFVGIQTAEKPVLSFKKFVVSR